MQDLELYRRILGIEVPWHVDAVELKLDAGEVHVHLAHRDGRDWPCAECGTGYKLYDHQPERRWRHLDTCQYRTILHAEPPRSACPEHGVRVVQLPWAEPSSRFTALLEGLAMEWLKAASQKAVDGLLHLTRISHHLATEARDRPASTSLRLLAVLNAGSSTPALVKRRAPPADAPLTHFAPPLHRARW